METKRQLLGIVEEVITWQQIAASEWILSDEYIPMVVQKIINEVTNKITTAMTDDRNIKTKNQFQPKNNTESYNKATKLFIDTSGSFIHI